MSKEDLPLQRFNDCGTMMNEINILTCCSMSPGGRVLRAALRNIAKEEKIRQFPLTPLIAGDKQFEDILRGKDILVVDGCDNSCSSRFLDSIDIKSLVKIYLDKYAHVTEENIKSAETRIKDAILEVKS